MKKTRLLRGVIPVLTTPIQKNGNIDSEGQQRLVEFLVSKRIGGLWVLGTGSEDMNLTFTKRVEAAKVVSETNAGRVPIILGAGFFALEDVLEFINETFTLDVDAFHVMPYHPLLSLDRLDWFFRHIADNCPKPLWMYTSANWSRAVTPEFIAALKDHPNIAGIKFSTRDAVDVAKVVKLQDDEFQVITAVAAQFYSCLCLGSKGHTSSLASPIPEAMIQIYDYFQSGDHGAALREQHKLIGFLNSLPAGARKDNFLMAAEEKYILSLRGICKEYTTSYYRDLTDQEKEKVREILKTYKIIPSLEL
jgi:4-hydroxy-tetrahydrodipicolinate synthase